MNYKTILSLSAILFFGGINASKTTNTTTTTATVSYVFNQEELPVAQQNPQNSQHQTYLLAPLFNAQVVRERIVVNDTTSSVNVFHIPELGGDLCVCCVQKDEKSFDWYTELPELPVPMEPSFELRDPGFFNIFTPFSSKK